MGKEKKGAAIGGESGSVIVAATVGGYGEWSLNTSGLRVLLFPDACWEPGLLLEALRAFPSLTILSRICATGVDGV